MEEIALQFNISSKHYGYRESAELRREISMRLDTALKDAMVGKWSGAASKFNSLEIYLAATNPVKAIEIVKLALSDHWLQSLMEIRPHSLDQSA